MEEKTERFVMRVSPEFLRLVDDWRRRKDEIPSRSDAVRTMAILGFTYGLEERTIVDLMSLISDMVEANDVPEKYAPRVNEIFSRLEKTVTLRDALVNTLDHLKNLPPAEPLPSRAVKKAVTKRSDKRSSDE